MSPNSSTDSYTNSARESTSGLVAYTRSWVDRIVSPDSRQRAYDSTAAFASDRPILFSFIVSQLLFSFLPFLLFATFSLSTVAFALGAAIIFALFWIGVAFMLLVPTLLVTSSVAVLVWGWAVGSFIVARWLYTYASAAGAQGGRVTVKKEGEN
ncbi:hypothetical protein ACJ41O_003168 [Fusarium nematophilum]